MVWFAYGFDPDVLSLGIVFIPLLALMVALCGAVAVTNTRVLQTRLLATGLSFGAVILAGTQLHTPIAGLAVAGVAVLLHERDGRDECVTISVTAGSAISLVANDHRAKSESGSAAGGLNAWLLSITLTTFSKASSLFCAESFRGRSLVGEHDDSRPEAVTSS